MAALICVSRPVRHAASGLGVTGEMDRGRDMRIGALQWAVGVFCAATGVLMLVAPHQYPLPEYATLRPHLIWSGGLFVLAGAALMMVPARRPRRSLEVAAHLVGGSALLALAVGFIESGIWTGTVNYSVLALATTLAPHLQRPRDSRRPTEEGDLFALAVGVGAAVNGLLFLALPGLFWAHFYDVPRPFLAWYGLLFLISGSALAYAQLGSRVPWTVNLAAHLAVALSFYAFGLPNLEHGTWTGAAYYGGFGLLLAFLPWLAPRLRRIELTSLKARLAMSLAAMTAIPLILIVAVETERDERMAVARVLGTQQAQAEAVARQVDDCLDRHRAAVVALAAQPGLLALRPEDQQVLLGSLNAALPDFLGLAIVDAAGREVSGVGEPLWALGHTARQPVLEGPPPILGPALELVESILTGRPMLLFSSPLHSGVGGLGGWALAAVETSHLGQILDRSCTGPERRAFVVDDRGRLLAQSSGSLAAPLYDLWSAKPVAALLAGNRQPGSVDYSAGDEEWLAGYAWLPSMGWGVVVEVPRAVALAGTRAGRDMAAEILMLVIGLSVVAGVVTAGFVSAPLVTFTRAVERLGTGDAEAPLPNTCISEIRRLAVVYGEMRNRLVARTAERERAQEAVRERERQQAAVAQLGQWALGGAGADAVMAEAVAVVARTMDVEFAGLLELLPHGGALLLRAGVGWGRGLVGHATLGAAADSPAGHALRRGEPVVVEDLRGETRFAGSALHRDHGVVSSVSVVVPGRDRPFGVLEAGSRRWRCFTPDDVSFLQAVANLLAMAVERKQAEDSQRFLAEASSLLASSLDLGTTLSSVARLALAGLAEWCTVDLIEKDGTVRQLAVAHADRSKEPLPRDLLRRHPAHEECKHPASMAMKTGRPQVIQEIPEAMLKAMGQGELVAKLREVGMESVVAMPMVARERVLGAITFVSARTSHRYRPEDLALAEELARRCALAVDNARLYQEAQQAIRIRDEFLSVAAHELRTPVTSLRGFAQLTLRLLDRDGRLDPDRVERALQVIDRRSDKLSRLVMQLLDVSRIQAGRLELDRQLVDVTGLVEGIVTTLQATTDRHNLILLAVSPAQAMVDPLRLEQVVTNLIDNAIKYSPDGGDIEIVLSMPDPESLRLEVRDHGVGIPPEHRDRIFERFYQVDEAGRKKGMGLGLYITHHIVSLHGGEIDTESPPDGGTRFVVSLPTRVHGEAARLDGDGR